MKIRHVIMVIILIIAISAVIDTKGVSYLTCNTIGTMYEYPSKSTLEISLQKDKIKDIDITVDINLKGVSLVDKENLIQMIEMQGKSKVTSTEEGIRLNSGMDGSYFASLGVTKDTKYGELKQVLELQGFTCK